MQEDVAHGDHALQLTGFTDEQMPEAVPTHEEAAGFHVLVRTDGEGIYGHHIADASTGGVVALDDHPTHQVALGKHPHQHSLAQYGNGSNVTVNHGAGHLQHALLDVGTVGILILDEIVDARHVAPPATRI